MAAHCVDTGRDFNLAEAAGRQDFLKKRGSAMKIQSTNALNCRRPTKFCERQSADDQYNQLSTIQQHLFKKL